MIKPQQGLDSVFALTIRDLDSNFLGDRTLSAKTPIIEAKELSAEGVWRKVKKKLRPCPNWDSDLRRASA